MEYNYGKSLVEFNDLFTAVKFIDAIQVGDYSKEHYMRSLSHRDILNPGNGCKGSVLMFAILMQRFVAAEWILENMNKVDSDEAIAEALSIADNTDYDSKIDKLREAADTNPIYQKMADELEANRDALNRLKERFLGKQRTNK